MQVTTTLLAGALLFAAQPSGDSNSASTEHALVSHAVVSLIDVVQVPATQSGVLKEISTEEGERLKEGMTVKKESLLAVLDQDDAMARQKAARLDHQVAEAEHAKSGVAIEAADKTADVARAEYLESIAVNERVPDSIPETQLRRQQLTEERARSEAKVARSDQETAGLTVLLRNAQIELATINLDRHSIRSPIEGEIVQLYRHVGEWVNPGDPLMRIVRLDRLRVEGFLKLSEFSREEVSGQPVDVEIQLPRGRTEIFQGTISYVSPLIQASGDYRVWCEIENRKENGHWVMLPGMDARLKILLKKNQLASFTR